MTTTIVLGTIVGVGAKIFLARSSQVLFFGEVMHYGE